MKSSSLFTLAAILEISGCFAFWQRVRQGRSALWLLPGLVLLAAFAWVLTQVNVAHAGRAYAIYGGIYIPHRSCGCGWWKGIARTCGI